MRPAIYNYAPASTTFIATSQAGTSGVALTLNPTTYDATNIATSQVVIDGGASRRSVSLTSTGDLSGVLFTIIGFDNGGITVNQTITGPNNATVYTTTGYTTVRTITPNGTFTSGVSAGIGTSGVTNMFIPSSYVPDFNVGVGIYVTGSLAYTLQHTFDDVFNTSYGSLRWFNNDDSALVNATTSQDSNYAFGVGGMRVSVTGVSGGGLTAIFRQAWH